MYAQQQASAYEKAVFDAVSCLISQDRDDDLALELHSKVSLFLHFSLNFYFFVLDCSVMEPSSIDLVGLHIISKPVQHIPQGILSNRIKPILVNDFARNILNAFLSKHPISALKSVLTFEFFHKRMCQLNSL